MKTKILCYLLFIICLTTILSGCSHENFTPKNVVFKNASLYGSPNYTITIVYGEDKRIRKFSTDTLIKTTAPQTTLKITKELGESWDITLPNAEEFYSLTSLIDENLDFATFSSAMTTTYIINPHNKCTLTFKVIGGSLNSEETALTDTFDVSDEFELECLLIS